MFEELDNIDWNKLGRGEIPSIIRNMASQDMPTQKNAFEMFESQVLYIDDSTPDGIKERVTMSDILKDDIQLLIIPFLFELLQQSDLASRNRAIGLFKFMTRYIEFVGEKSKLWQKAVKIRDTIWQSNELFLSLLEDPREDIRMEVIKLLAAYPQYADITIPHIFKLFEHETDSNKVKILWNIDTAFAEQETNEATKKILHDMLTSIITPDSSYDLRITATVTLIDIFATNTPEFAIKFLVDALIAVNKKPSSVYLVSVTPGKQAHVLTRLGVLKGLPAALKVIKETTHIENGFNALVSAIILAFFYDYNMQINYSVLYREVSDKSKLIITLLPKNLPVDLSILNASQEAIVETIVNQDWIWRTETNLFKVFGLPQTREEFRNLM